ncbi:MAG TPA: phenylacetate--CoA ligase [Methylomirabilota bacterium]|jgi:phenylacetate-CoA ligase|nr:phenylacetate--CoA ligase [Methylomirabilota bacterium]
MIWNPEAETMRRPERERLQVERLRRAVARAVEGVAFYRDSLGAAGIEPDAIRSLAQLTDVPFTAKDDLRAHYPFGLLAVPRRRLLRVHASSGTKGKPTVVGYTRNDLDLWREVMARLLAAAGAMPGEMIQVAYGYGLFTGGLGFHDAAEHMGLTVVPASSGNTVRQILLLEDFRPQGLACTPSFALHIGEAMREQGREPRSVGLRYGIFGAEPWTEAMRTQLEELWGVPALDCYGLSEIIGPGVAGECVEGRPGLHVNEDHFLPEIVDPGSGEPLAAGREGELVLTCLTREALPLIRYRTGDITSLDSTPCACGRTTARMARIKGRTDDMVVIKGVNVYPSQLEAALLAFDDLAPHYQLVVDRTRAFPTVEVHVEPGERLVREWGGFDAGRPETLVLSARVAERIRAHLGLNLTIAIVPPKSIPRSEGKAVRVVEVNGQQGARVT